MKRPYEIYGETDFGSEPQLHGERGQHFYGHRGTIHNSSEVNVEVNSKGEIVGVWFRCMMLPFTQSNVDDNRAESLRDSYKGYGVRLVGFEYEYEIEKQKAK